MEAVGPRNLHQQHAANPDDVGPLDDDQSGRDVPQLMFPRPREEEHKEEPMHPLLEAGTFGGDDDACPAAFAVDGGDEPLGFDGGNVDVQEMVKHPARLAVDHIDRPQHELVDPLPDGPIAQSLPAQIDEMKADDQDDKKPNVDRAAVSWIFAVCLEVFKVHQQKIWGEITKLMNNPYLCIRKI